MSKNPVRSLPLPRLMEPREAHRQEAAEAATDTEVNFSEAFSLYSPAIYYLFLRWGLTASEAEDLTQEVFLRVYRNFAQLKEAASLEQWIRSIALNQFRAWLRQKGAQMRSAHEVPLEATGLENSPDLEMSISVRPHSNISALEELIETEQAAILRRAIRQLPPQMQRCSILRYAYGLKFKEIAALLGITVPAVSSQLTAATRRLKEALSRPGWREGDGENDPS